MKTVKVKIIKLHGDTGLMTPGKLLDVSPPLADRWIRNGLAELVEKPKRKTKKKK